MRVKSALAVAGVAAAFGVASPSSAEAGWCEFGWCGPQPVEQFVYYPQYRNVYYQQTWGPQPYPYPYIYMPQGYWPSYGRPFKRYARRMWRRQRRRGYYVQPVPPPMPVPVQGCCQGGYLK